jgi:hypothetical protein
MVSSSSSPHSHTVPISLSYTTPLTHAADCVSFFFFSQGLPLPMAVQPAGQIQEGAGEVLRSKSGEVLALQSLKIEGRPQCGVQVRLHLRV